MNRKDPSYALEYLRLNFPVNFPIIGFFGEEWNLTDDTITYLHCHNCIELGLCRKGSGILKVENKTKEFSSGDIIVVCPDTMHKSASEKGTVSEWDYINVEPEKLVKDYFGMDLPQISLLRFDFPEFPNVISGAEHPEMMRIFQRMVREMSEKRENYQLSTACLCLSFLIMVMREIPEEATVSTSGSSTGLAVYPALNYIDSHYAENIHIRDLAVISGFSETQFRRVFKRIMNCSPLDYVNRVRVNKSCELLYNTDKSVLEIAMSVGYAGIPGFNRNFTSRLKITPLQWRKHVRTYRKESVQNTLFPNKYQ